MTVYRALDFLVSRGIAHRIESLNAYVSCTDNHCDHKDSEFFICEKCGHIEEFHNHEIDNAIQRELHKFGYLINSKNLEILGTCKNCL